MLLDEPPLARATLRDAAPQPVAAAPAAPKISLKIRRDESGGLTSAMVAPPLTVDPLEEAQLNALHERLQKIAREHDVPHVQPEATSFMYRARARTSTGCSPRARSARTARRGPPPSPPTCARSSSAPPSASPSSPRGCCRRAAASAACRTPSSRRVEF